MHAPRGHRLLPLAALGVALAPTLATAGDGLHPRTPVLFDSPPCMTIVDRSVDPVLELVYTIPYEDLKPEYDPDDMSTWHEVDNGRTHQFFGFCRDHDPQTPLPNWITQADLDAAVDKGLIDPEIVDPEDIFESSTDWAGCWHRITGDDERREITFAEAAKPVLWDTSDLEVGSYVIEGYTWEPWINLWSFRSGVVKVVDSDDPAASPPALAIVDNIDFTYADQAVPLDVCHSAADGATMTAYWSFTDADKFEWIPFLEDAPVVADMSTIDFTPPAETAGSSVMIRIDVTDGMDRSATAYANYTITVIEGMASTGGDCGESSFVGNPDCETTGGTDGTDGTDGTATTAGTDSTTGGTTGDATGTATTASGSASTGGQMDDPEGCACRLDDPRPAAAFGLAFLLLLRRRRVR
ncbi:MAG: MYXO-CTERM sorting domain-containing protein [Nannocystaceae bacterium]